MNNSIKRYQRTKCKLLALNLTKLLKSMTSLCLVIILILSLWGCSAQDNATNSGDVNSKDNQQNESALNQSDEGQIDEMESIDLTKTLVNAIDYLDNPSFYTYGDHRIAETESGYFILMNYDLYFLDKETGLTVLFSNDPMTTDELMAKRSQQLDLKHEAYYPNATNVFYYNEKLYICELSEVDNQGGSSVNFVEVDPKTHERKVLTNFKSDNTQFALVSGKLLALTGKYSVDTKKTTENNTDQSSKSGLHVKHSIVGYDIIRKQDIEPIDLPTSSEYSLGEISSKFIQGYNDKFYVDIRYDEIIIDENKSNALPKGEHILYILDLNDNSISEIELANMPDNDKDLIFSYTFLDDKMYLNKSTLDPVNPFGRGGQRDIFFQTADLKGQNNQDFLKPDGNYQMLSNGTDLFAIPSQFIILNSSEQHTFPPFALYKYADNNWALQQDFDVSETGLGTSMRINNVSISSTGDLFLHGMDVLYMVRNGEVTKIIDYSQYYQF